MQRKEFLKTACTFCIAVGAGIALGSLESCVKQPVYKTQVIGNTIRVPLTMFEKAELQLIRPNDFEFDIALRKEHDGRFTALLMRCTHSENQLISTGNGFVCNAHGSKFDEEGNVTKSPATNSLKKYKTIVEGEYVLILTH